jgi:hypothetical protein
MIDIVIYARLLTSADPLISLIAKVGATLQAGSVLQRDWLVSLR